MSSATTRIEGPAKVTGAAMYAAEAQMAGMLHAVLAQAPIARGRVVAIDGTAARACAGFADLVGWEDAQALQASPFIDIVRAPAIYFPGQPVALVAAETLAQARAAGAAMRIDYAAEPAITFMNHPLAAPYAPDMCGARAKAYSLRGDPAGVLAEAEMVVRARYETAVNNHHPMEPHAVVCQWDGDNVEVHTSTQAIFGTRAGIAHAFRLPAANVRVITRFLGGGFGCKGQLWWPYMMLALLAARRTGRPVRLELTRAQLFSLVGRRQETVQDLAISATRDGMLTAIDHQVRAQTSTQAEYADPVAYMSRLMYACPNVVTGHILVPTNEPRPIPMRGPGEAPGSFALESALDELAHKIGLDPLELRLRNHADQDQDAGRPWSSNSLLACWTQGAEKFGWANRTPQGWTEGRLRIGWGVAGACYGARRQACSSRVHIGANGALLVQCGTQDMGSGTTTVLGQLAAQMLGLPMSSVTVELGDTVLPPGPFSAGSQVTQSVFPSVTKAASSVRDQLASMAASDPASPLFGCVAANLVFADGRLRDPAGNASDDLAALLARGPPEGLEALDETPLVPTTDVTAMGFGAVFAEVSVDPDLGEVRVRRICGAFAAGHIVNPLLARSQYVGGIIGGIGMALHEQTRTDHATGRIVGASFVDYLIPVHADIPEIDIIMVPEQDPHLPGGVKGVGMLGSVGTSAAIANAIFHATGQRIRHLPIHLEDIVAQ